MQLQSVMRFTQTKGTAGGQWGSGGPDPCDKKNCNLIFKKQIFPFNVCVMSVINVQFFVNVQSP